MPALAMRIHHLHHHSAWNIAGDLMLALAIIATICLVVALVFLMVKRPSPISWVWALIVAVVAWVLLAVLF